jgi:hypothetical protein
MTNRASVGLGRDAVGPAQLGGRRKKRKEKKRKEKKRKEKKGKRKEKKGSCRSPPDVLSLSCFLLVLGPELGTALILASAMP